MNDNIEKVQLVSPDEEIEILTNQVGDPEFRTKQVEIPGFSKAFIYGFNAKDSYGIDDNAAAFVNGEFEIGSGNIFANLNLFDILVYFPLLPEAKAKKYCYMWIPGVKFPYASELTFKKTDNPDEPMAYTSYWIDYNNEESTPPNYLFAPASAEELSQLRFSIHDTLPFED